MKIAYVVNARIPTERAHGLQIMAMCRAFAQNGHEVRLFVPRRKNPLKMTPWEYYGVRPEFEIVEIPIVDCIPFERLMGRSALWLNAIQFSLRVRFALQEFAPDVVYGREPWFVGAAGEVPFVYEAHDFPARISFFHRRWWKDAARIVPVTGGLQKVFVAEGVPQEKIVVAHDGVDQATFAVRESKQEARRTLGLPPEDFIAVYTGHLYSYKGADDALEACAHLRAGLRVVFVGGRPDDLARMKARATELGITNATFVGHVPHERIPKYLRAADVALLPTRAADRHASEFLSPLKLFEYLAAGKAIVATDLPSVREVIDTKTAVLVPPSDPIALADALNDLASSPERVQSLERESLKLAAEHTWMRRAERVLPPLDGPKPHVAWHRRYRTELLLALLALALRVLYVTCLPQVKIAGGDGEIYLGLSDLVRGLRDHVPSAPVFYPIFYPYFLAFMRTVFGNDLVWIRLMQALFSAGTVFAMALMARRWINARAGIATGLLGALYVPMILESGTIYTETVYTFFLTVSVGLAVLAVQTKKMRTALLAGVAFVFTGLTRELGFYQALLFAVWASITRRSWKLGVLILVPTLLALGGIAFRNASIAERLSLDSQPLVAKRYEASFTEPTLARFLFAPERWHLYPEGAFLYFRFPFRLSNLGSGEPIDGKLNPQGDVVYHLNPRVLVASQPLPQVLAKGLLTVLHWLFLACAAYGLWRGQMAKEAKIGFFLALFFAFATIMFQGIHRLQGFEGLEPLARYRFPTEPLILILAVAGAQALRFKRRK